MQYKGITIFSDPRHGSVKRVQKLKNKWYMKNLPLAQLDQTMSISDAIQKAMSEDMSLLMEFQEFLENVADYQEIMLATTLTYEDILQLEDQLTPAEFNELVDMCKCATGGVDTFFDKSSTGTVSKTTNATQEQAMPDYTSCSGQPGGFTQGSIMHTKEDRVNSVN